MTTVNDDARREASARPRRLMPEHFAWTRVASRLRFGYAWRALRTGSARVAALRFSPKRFTFDARAGDTTETHDNGAIARVRLPNLYPARLLATGGRVLRPAMSLGDAILTAGDHLHFASVGMKGTTIRAGGASLAARIVNPRDLRTGTIAIYTREFGARSPIATIAAVIAGERVVNVVRDEAAPIPDDGFVIAAMLPPGTNPGAVFPFAAGADVTFDLPLPPNLTGFDAAIGGALRVVESGRLRIRGSETDSEEGIPINAPPAGRLVIGLTETFEALVLIVDGGGVASPGAAAARLARDLGATDAVMWAIEGIGDTAPGDVLRELWTARALPAAEKAGEERDEILIVPRGAPG
ncbi:hypothetical protein K8I61_12205 [bacterium]|nr:hypothetical protein [bacterium]